MTSERPTAQLTALMSAGLMASVLGFATFPALLPVFFAEWRITNTEAGWINGIYYLGYVAASLVVVALTDRVDARRVLTASLVVNALAALAFATLAQGFWSALALRALSGVGLAGTFMPGVKILADRTQGAAQGRGLSYFTAAFGFGVSISYLLAGEMEAAFGWRAAFAVTALGPLLNVAIVRFAVRGPASPPRAGGGRLFDYAPVLRARHTMAYVAGAFGHLWELMAFRGWTVAFLAFAEARHGADFGVEPTRLAALIALVGVPGIVLGGELAVRFGRRPVVIALMALSAVLASGIGFAAALPLPLLAALLVVYGLIINADSPILAAGNVATAPEGYRGAALAVHSCSGFLGGFLGPLGVGVTLDLMGGTGSLAAWGIALGTAGLAVGGAALALAILGRGEARDVR